MPERVTRWRNSLAAALLLGGRERCHHGVEVRAHDPLGAPEGAQRLEAQGPRAGPLLLVPQPQEHELEVGSLDPGRLRATAYVGRARVGLEAELPRLDLVEHLLDEALLCRDLVAGAGSARVLLERADDRLSSRVAVQVLEAQRVVEEVRQPRLEAVELSERVLANRKQEAHAQITAVDDPRELERERALALLLLVVAEVLLELVEDHEEPAADPSAASSSAAPRSARRAPAGSSSPKASVTAARTAPTSSASGSPSQEEK